VRLTSGAERQPDATYWLEHAWLDNHVEPGVAVDVAGERIIRVRTRMAAPPPGATTLRGLTLPGLANTHSHAFHRALRSTVQVGSGTFWTWRDVMYRIAARLTPDTYYALARATYAEMALAGITCVGEFHYLHHAPGGTPYDNPNAMGEALIAAAADAGIRITLLDTAYLASGISGRPGGAPPDRHQVRFSDGSAQAWAVRASSLKDSSHARIGAAIHSVRAVPADQLSTVAAWADSRAAPLHVHLSEQTAENDACFAVHGRTPARLLADHGVLGPRTTGVHNTHLTEQDIALLGATHTGTCMCPTTERDLADGIGPALSLQREGSPLSLGSDSHAVIDIFEEARAMELDERLRSRTRGHWTAAALLHAATEEGHTALGWPEAGRIEQGALADLVTIGLDSVRTAGPLPRLGAETAVFAATAADVRHTVVGGRHVVRDGAHALVPDVPAALAESIAALRG
jgi:formiminoglutamate deiminase